MSVVEKPESALNAEEQRVDDLVTTLLADFP
ncbi:MAG: hypothetical protein JWN39_475, partial [Ilumatobacteraceae bacterium]|nr:hypothetical protein [Ilumatobacteraceae bacterium]